MAQYLGAGQTSSSDGQFFPTTRQGEAMNLINAKYDTHVPGLKAYAHVSDQYGPYWINSIPATVNEAPYILDGLCLTEIGKKIKEHYVDTGGFTKRLNQTLKKSPRCLRIAMLLNQNVQCIPICIDRAPEPIFLAIDWNYELIQMPFIRRTRPVTSYAVSKMSTETVYPKPDRFAADNQATLGKKIFYIRSAQCKAIIRLHRVGDHLSRKTETFETRQGTWYLHAYRLTRFNA